MTEAAVAHRVFFALWPDVPALEALDRLASVAVERCGGRRMCRDSLHLTLAFIGAVSAEPLAQLQEIATGVRATAYELTLDRLGCWPHNRILWAGCSRPPPRQRRLFEALVAPLAQAGFQLDRRPHLPHVTLARNARCDAGLPDLAQPIRWRVREFALVESRLLPSGALYRNLAHWPLDESD